MTTEVTMPKLSDTMTEGQIGAWRKSVGDRIERGDVIAEVETDKATMDLEAFASGVLLEQRVQAGEIVPVGTVIGLIGAAGESAAPRAPTTATARPRTATPPTDESAPPSMPAFARSTGNAAQAAPVVRRRAAELRVDLNLLQGSGPGGRIMLEDLDSHTPADSTEPPDAVIRPLPIESPAIEHPPAAQSLSRMRIAIARTTTASWQSIPHFYLTRAIEMDKAGQAIRGLKADGVEVSLNALILAAAAMALAAFPAVNACYSEGGIVSYPDVNLAFAVALDDGLQMPVIKDAGNKGVRELTAESARLATVARQGKLAEDEISGGSFSVSNLGMYGVDSLASIIMPGQAAILGVGSVAERPLARNGAVVIAEMMTATLSCDHRIVDGTTAAAFLGEFKRLLEHPSELPA